MENTDNKTAIDLLRKGYIGVMPTDTILGLVGPALSRGAVSRIYEVRGRDLDKPMIILISSKDDLGKFGVETNKFVDETLSTVWPGRVSVILPTTADSFDYLSRGHGTLAFRLPNDPELLEILKQTGPLVAPSANPQGMKPATDMVEAKKYFGQTVDFYLDGAVKDSKPSKLIKFDGENIVVLRS